MSLDGNFAYGNAISASYYAQGIRVDETTGDLYIVYREFNGRIRQYERSSSGTYSASSYTQVYTYARYSNDLAITDDYVYTSGYYYSSYYGGVKKYATGGTSASTLSLIHI